MIKTVSFAPPRSPRTSGSGNPSSSSRPSSKRRTPRATPGDELNLFDSPFVSPSPASDEVVETPAPRLSTKRTKAIEDVAPIVEEVAPQEVVVDEVVAPQIPVKEPKKPRVKRAIVPTNLAEQYGAKQSRRVESGQIEAPEVETPKKRLTKVEREARKQISRVDEGLLERLARAQAIIPAKKVAKPRGWRFECGRCGTVSHFETPVELCNCGAIAVKE